MARELPLTFIEAVTASATSQLYLHTLHIRHESFPDVRIVNDTQNLVVGEELYTRFPFSVVLPADSDEIQPTVQISVQNATLLLVEGVRKVAGHRDFIQVDLAIRERATPDPAIEVWSSFELRELSYDKTVMTFTLVVENFLSEPMSSKSFNPAEWRGLF